MSINTQTTADAPGVLGSSLRQRIRAVTKHRRGLVGAVIVGIFIMIAVLAPLLEPYNPSAQSCTVFAPPSSAHWLGCDGSGSDVLSELLQGGRISMIVGFTATLVAIVIGGGVGLLSGYFGGLVDSVLMRVTDYLLVIPDLVLMIVIADIWGPSLFHVIMVIGILLWTSTARVVRAQVKSVRERTYIKRGQMLGASNTRIVLRHVLPQVGPLLIASAVVTIAIAIYDETALAFLGLTDPTQTSWGTILEFAFQRSAISAGAWWTIIPDGVCIALVVIGCYLMGQAIEDALNPRLRVAHVSIKPWRLRPLVGRGRGAI